MRATARLWTVARLCVRAASPWGGGAKAGAASWRSRAAVSRSTRALTAGSSEGAATARLPEGGEPPGAAPPGSLSPRWGGGRD